MNKFLFLLFLLPFSFNFEAIAQKDRVNAILKELNNPTGKNVIVVAHRGDWRNAPENSIQAIKNVIEMGVDVVEIDVQKTKDGKLILMHDVTLDRTTTGKGKTIDYTLEEIKKLHLKSGVGVATRHKVPTLEEALEFSKDKILVNIDKGYEYFSDCYEVMRKTGTVNQVIIKGSVPYEKVKKENAEILNKVIYMPIVNLSNPKARQVISDFAENLKPVAYEIVMKNDTSSVINDFSKIKAAGSRVWANSLWPSLNAGHDDDLSVEEKKPDEGWGWLLSKGANIIQTDRPKELLEYLRNKRRHR